jgi:hypothetical protein
MKTSRITDRPIIAILKQAAGSSPVPQRISTTLEAWKVRKKLAATTLAVFEALPSGKKFPTVATMWRRQRQQVIPFFADPPAVRTSIRTTNAVENLPRRLRHIVQNCGHFPSDEAATKLRPLALRIFGKYWKMQQRTCWRTTSVPTCAANAPQTRCTKNPAPHAQNSLHVRWLAFYNQRSLHR